jgi:putative membrane protein
MHKSTPDMASLGILAAAVITDLLCRFYPAHLPYFFPFIFNAPVFLGTWFVILWYFRGLARTPADQQPSRFRKICFLGGVLSIYFVLQTRFEYLSQHLFSLNRTQAVTISMAAPFFIGIAWMQDVLARGIPAWLLAACRSKKMHRIGLVLFHPIPAMVVFLITSDIWLIPAVHFAAMINPALYDFMNLTCLAGGMIFWLVVLDPRPKPLSRISYITRAGIGFLVMFPQIAISSYIALTTQDLYAFYTLCGRIFPAMSPAYDQMLGGMIQWIPPGMMNTAALMLALNSMRLSDLKTDKTLIIPPGAKVYESKWTGR